MGACIGKRWLVGLCRGSEDSVQEENTSAVYAYINEVHDYYPRVNGGSRPEDEYQTHCMASDWRNLRSSLDCRNFFEAHIFERLPQEIDEPDKTTSITTLYDLPLEVLDTILQKSYLHWSLNSPKRQKDEEVIRSLISVDVCFNRRITRQRFKKTLWRHLKVIYDRTKKRSAIIRNNRSYLSETVQPNDEFINSLFYFKCITEEQRHSIQRQHLQLDKNAELLHIVGSFDDSKFSTFVKCLRQTNQTAVARIVRNGGVVIKVKVTPCGTVLKDQRLLHQSIEDLRSGTKPGSHETGKLISQLNDAGVEILSSQLGRQTVVVWVWCRSQSALEHFRKKFKSSQLSDVLFDLAVVRPSTSEIIQSIVLSIDQHQFEKTVAVVSPISVNFTERINVGRNETVCGVTKLRAEIYVLCQPFPSVIRVFEGRRPFRLQEEIDIKDIEDQKDLQSSEKDNCLYVSAQREKCVWKITRQTDYQHNVFRWLTIDYAPHTLSVSSSGHLLLVTAWSSVLNIYGSEAELLRSIQLPRDIEDSIHAVETSMGNFIILHQCMETGERETGPNGRIKEWTWAVSELTRDGQMVVSRFLPSNETQKLENPRYLTLDSDDQVYVTDTGNDRVILLDSDLKWNRSLCSSMEEHEEEEEEEETVIRRPLRSYYDEREKQLIVGGGYFYLGGFNIYTVRQQ